MRRLYQLVIISALLAAFVGYWPSATQAADDSYRLDNFQSNLTIQSDGRVLVDEQISVNLNSLLHGIYRDFPYAYTDKQGQKSYLEFTFEQVQMDGAAVEYRQTLNDANIRLQIGDPNHTTSGVHTYHLVYLVTGALRGYQNYDELYWNITGNQWTVPIEQASTTITLQTGTVVQVSCYMGESGATERCGSSAVASDQKSASFSASRVLEVAEGMTAAVGYTKGAVPLLVGQAPKTFANSVSIPGVVYGLLLPLILAFVLLRRKWQQNGRDAGGARLPAIMPEYAPPGGLRPGEIGVLVDERADTVDVSATIVDLAARGFLTITEEPKKWLLGGTDYLFHRTNQADSTLLGYEKTLLAALFKSGTDVRMSDLKDHFYTDLAAVKKELYQELTDRGFFTDNPQKVRNRYIGWGLAILILGIPVAVLFSVNFVSLITNQRLSAVLVSSGFGVGLGITLSGIATMLASLFMPSRTQQGFDLYRQALGYKLFVSGTEKYRQPFFEKQNIIMEVLPYAIVFGVTKKLAQAFAEMGIQPPQPSWYYGVGPFNFVAFSNNLDSFSQSLSTAMASAPSSSGSSGGGFSGGGFGGGGGGSW